MKISGQQKAEESADHKQIAVREVDHGQDAINHRVSQSNQRVDAAELQSIKNLLENIGHRLLVKKFLLSPPFLKEALVPLFHKEGVRGDFSNVHVLFQEHHLCF